MLEFLYGFAEGAQIPDRVALAHWLRCAPPTPADRLRDEEGGRDRGYVLGQEYGERVLGDSVVS